jgi:hypothetical protein
LRVFARFGVVRDMRGEIHSRSSFMLRLTVIVDKQSGLPSYRCTR